MTVEELKADLALDAAALIVGDDVPDQEQLNEFPRLVGSLLKAYGTPEWQAKFPALADVAFRTRKAFQNAATMVVNKVASQFELNEFGKVAGSLDKAFDSPEWQAAVPGFVAAASGAPSPPAAP